MPWWSSPDANPNWRPPSSRTVIRGGERLREKLWEILVDANSEAWFNALARLLPPDALRRFLDGDDQVLTPEQTKTIVVFTGEFGRDMETNRLVRRPRGY